MKSVIYATPDQCFVNPEPFKLCAIVQGETGYYPIYSRCKPEQLNPAGLTQEIIDSAISASMFGWNAPCAELANEFFNKEQSK